MENPADIGVVRELMLLMVAYDHFNSKFENYTWTTRPGVVWSQKTENLLGNRTVSIVRLGIFQIEEVTMPTLFEDLRKGHLFTDFHLVLKGSLGEDIPWQFDIWMLVVGRLDYEKRNGRI